MPDIKMYRCVCRNEVVVMEEKPQEKKNSISIKEAFLNWIGLFLVIISSLAVFLIITNIQPILDQVGYFVGILKPVVYGCVIAYLLNPLVKFYQRWMTKPFRKNKKILSGKVEGLVNGLAITLGLVSGILIIVVLCWMVLPQLFSSMISMIENVPSQANYYYELLTKWVEESPYMAEQIQKGLLGVTDFLDKKMNTELFPWLRTELLPNINTYAVQLASGVMGVVNVLYNVFIGIIVAIYLLASKRRFSAQAKKLSYGLFRKEYADVLIHYVQISNETFSGFISGKIVDSTIIGILCFLAMSIMDLPYALLVSVVVGVTNVIPVFGPYIGAIPSVILILLIQPMQALYFLILIVILQQLDGNIIGPAILGESTGLSAFWVLFSILFFGGLWGIVGMLIGVPLFAVIYRIITDIVNVKLRKKSLSTVTDHYLDLKQIQQTEQGITEYIKYSPQELSGKRKSEWKENRFIRWIEHKGRRSNVPDGIDEEGKTEVQKEKADQTTSES